MTAPLFPPRAVIDTNVLLDFWVFDDPIARPLRTALESGRLIALRDGATVDELADVVARIKFDLSAHRQMEILRLWDRLSQPVGRVFPSRLHCTDPLDQKFLDLAVSARADWLVSKDKAVLKLARKARADGLAILRPDQASAQIEG